MFRCKHQCINTLGNQLVSVHTNQMKLIVHDGKNIKTTLSFREGNGRSTRIWLDMILKQNVKMCVDWSKINKQEYLNAMTHSVVDSAPIKKLLFAALTDKIDDSETFMKGIDYSYYYEQED